MCARRSADKQLDICGRRVTVLPAARAGAIIIAKLDRGALEDVYAATGPENKELTKSVIPG